MKIKQPSSSDVFRFVNFVLVAVVMAFMMVNCYPLLVKFATPLDSFILPPALLGLKLSSALIGAFACSVVSAVPAMARALVPDTRSIVCRD